MGIEDEIETIQRKDFRNYNKMGNNNIKGIVVNLGSGTINTGNITVNSTVNKEGGNGEILKQLTDLTATIEKIAEQYNEVALNEKCAAVRQELAKEDDCDFGIVRKLFNGMKDVAVGVTANILTPIVQQALSIL